MKQNKKNQGFTLLELLIVIAIIAILSVILVLVLNPAETLKKSRDAQRISDLSTMKTAIGILLTSSSSPVLGTCGTKIYYSVPTETAAITDTTLNASTTITSSQVAEASIGLVNGTGWLPINLSWLPGGSPVSNMPIDPVNTIGAVAAVANTDLVYRYSCEKNGNNNNFEIDAVLESDAYTVDDKKMVKDGGNNTAYYEVGTKLSILGAGTDF